MLRRLTLLWALCFGGLFVSLPAGACCFENAPMHDCCPHGQRSPEQISSLGLLAGAEACCSQGVAGSVALAIAPTRFVREVPPSDPPPLAVVYPTQIPASLIILPDHRPASLVRLPSGSTLYLSTRRLRL